MAVPLPTVTEGPMVPKVPAPPARYRLGRSESDPDAMSAEDE